LRVIQLNTLEDRNICDKNHWDEAVSFFETSLKSVINANDQVIRNLVGPNFRERWFNWKYTSEQEQKRSFIKSEIDKLLFLNQVIYTCIIKVNTNILLI
jgi:optic atrophy protein 1